MQRARSQTSPPLPQLRGDLTFHVGVRDGRGNANRLIHDPVRHRYFQIDADTYELLAVWRPVSLDAFRNLAAIRLRREVSEEELKNLVQFLFTNNLTLEPTGDDSRAYAKQVAVTKRSVLSRILHSYLFFKIPLVRPQKFLERTYPVVAPLFSRAALWSVVIVSLLGLYLASRRWEMFVATFLDFLSFEGLACYGLALIVIKSLHELGHAYTATRYGVRVNTMGIAFMLLFPILFTDVTDAWKLQKRRQRLAIAGAGMIVELAIAGLATFVWVFLPEGPERSVAFVLATTSWAMSLAVNLNPFMRFDGYYLLADAWGMANLQPRAFGMARWQLREFLFGVGGPPPEQLSVSQSRWLAAYGFGVWIYRFVLFLGIALVVYHLFFKVLGVILFAIEIIWFIALPVWKEFVEWWKMRHELVGKPRTWWTVGILSGLLFLAFTPFQSNVRIPSMMMADREFRVFAPRPARVASVALRDGVQVDAGMPLVRLDSPDLDHKMRIAESEIALNEARLRRIAGDDRDRADMVIIRNRLDVAKKRLAGYHLEKAKLTLSSPFQGQQRDVMRGLAPGDWVDPETALVRIVGNGRAQAAGYVHEDDVWKLSPGMSAVFVPEDPLLARRSGRLAQIARTGSRQLEIPYLASVFGGAIPSDRTSQGAVEPRAGHYRVRVALDRPPVGRAVRGTLLIAGERESFAAFAWRRVLQVFVREAGI